MPVAPGDKVHIITRRGFDGDLRRHFAGEVLESSEQTLYVTGYVFVHDLSTNAFARRPERRTRIFSLIDAGNIINVLPATADIETLAYQMAPGRRLVITDGKEFQLDINEFGSRR